MKMCLENFRTSSLHTFDIVCHFFRVPQWILWGKQNVTHTGTPKRRLPFPLLPPELQDAPVARADRERVLPPGQPPPLQVLPHPLAQRVILLRPCSSSTPSSARHQKGGAPSGMCPMADPGCLLHTQITAELGFHHQNVPRTLIWWVGRVEICGYVPAQLCAHDEYKMP